MIVIGRLACKSQRRVVFGHDITYMQKETESWENFHKFNAVAWHHKMGKAIGSGPQRTPKIAVKSADLFCRNTMPGTFP